MSKTSLPARPAELSPVITRYGSTSNAPGLPSSCCGGAGNCPHFYDPALATADPSAPAGVPGE